MPDTTRGFDVKQSLRTKIVDALLDGGPCGLLVLQDRTGVSLDKIGPAAMSMHANGELGFKVFSEELGLLYLPDYHNPDEIEI